MVYDLIILGAGPAGLSASVYASRYKINHLIIGELPGGLMTEAHKVCNFPSEIEISGWDLFAKMKAHVDSFETPQLMTKATEIKKEGEVFVVKTADNQEFSAKTILLATGTSHKKLDLENEKKFLGKGVSYCATCDAMFYKNKKVAILGGGNSATTAAIYLSELAERVYQIVRGPELKGETAWIEQAKNNPKIEFLFNTNVVALEGEEKLAAIKIDNPYQEKDMLEIDGIFLEIGLAPNVLLADQLNLSKDKKDHIIVDASQATSFPGVYAAGDLTTGSNYFRQIITACSEGSIAAEAIFKYLQTVK